ncbi:putative histone acetyltransferase chromatin regulator PHD family [Helianthus annuus]|nr:putative histone acetyltransferase chromatin regulator PHD family [Helianthus annuus]KAJ0883731.1 putative histone acetyltransferase chromatin regulator PHD family [Helianthus annuus]
MKDLGRSAHSVDVVKKKSSSGCLIIKRKVSDGDRGVVKGFSDSSSRNLFNSVKDVKRPRLIRSDSESSDEFTEPYSRKIDRSRDRLAFGNGGYVSNRELETRKRVSNGVEFDEYDEFHERRVRKGGYDHRLDSHWQDGERMGSGSGSNSGRRIYDNRREFEYDGRNINLDAKSNRFDYGNGGNGSRYKMEDDELRLPHSVLSGKYQQVSDAPIRLQGKNGVLKVMVKKHKPISVPFQDYEPAQREERKESTPVLYKKKQLNVSRISIDRWDLSDKNKAVMGSSMYSGSIKPVLTKSQVKSDSDVSLPVKSSTVLHSSNEKLVKSEKRLSPQAKNVAPVKGKETKVKRGSGTEKQLLREKIRSMLLSAGWTIDYRPRRNRDYLDAVYINPSGTAYWSIIKAYEALQKEGKDHSQVGTEFTPLPIETLSKLTRQTRKKIEREMKMKRNEEGKFSETSKRRSMEASQDSGDDDSNDKDYMETANKRNTGIITHMVPERRSNKLGRCTLLIRREGKKSENDLFVPYSGKRTLLSWLIDSGTVQMNEKVQYKNRKQTRVMQEGWITKEGIHCVCCSKILTVLKFELHAGSKLRQPYVNIFVQSGKSLIECMIDAWNKQGELERKGFHAVDMVGDDPNDDTCGLCGDGGDLICCDGCPSTFHQSCLGIQMLPQGDWHCPNCSCKYCEMATEAGVKAGSTPLVCCLCERKYHESCNLEMDDNSVNPTDPNLSFCGHKCRQLYNNLQKLVGVKHELDAGFSWCIIHRSDVSLLSPEACSSTEILQKVECNSKLAVALSVIDECFMPIVDRRSRINLIHNVVYNCGSNLSRLNYSGFFTAILERADEIVCAASIRIHGTQLAEMPFIGTRHIYRRQGMCRRLLSAIESALASFHVEKLIIPAIAEHMHTWTDVFGFKPLEESHRQEMRSMNMLVFPGTDMLQKSLDKIDFEIQKSEPISPDAKESSEKTASTDSDSKDPPASFDDSVSSVKNNTHLSVLTKNVHTDSVEAKDDVKVTIDKTVDADSESKVEGFSVQICKSIPPEDPDLVLQDSALLSKESDSVDVKPDSHVEECVSKNPGLLAGTESVSASTDSDSIVKLSVQKGTIDDHIPS